LLALALHARVGGAQLRLPLSHSVADRTAAARLRLGGAAPGSCPSSTREGGRRAAPTYVLAHSVVTRTARLRRVGRRGAQSLALALHVRRVARCFDLALARCCGSYLCGAGGRRGAQTLALALQAKVGGARLRLTLSHSVAARTATARLRLGGIAPGSCLRSAREGGGARLRLAMGGAWRAAPTYALFAQHNRSCCRASTVGWRCAQAALAIALHAGLGGARLRRALGGARLRLTLLYSIVARAAARLWFGGVAPRPALAAVHARGAARGSDLRSVAASRHVNCCSASAVRQRGVQTLALALHARV